MKTKKKNKRTVHLMVSITAALIPVYYYKSYKCFAGRQGGRRCAFWRYPCPIDLETLPQVAHSTVSWRVEETVSKKSYSSRTYPDSDVDIWGCSVLCGEKIPQQVPGQRVLHNIPHNKCGRDRLQLNLRI